MYNRLRDYARNVLGGLQPDLQKYFLEYQRDFGSFEAVTSSQELLDAIQKTHIAICGDYHTLAQAQRTVIRLLNPVISSLKREDRTVILVLEMLREGDEKAVEKYLAGELNESEFLKKIDFAGRWGFDWRNYREIFDFARESGLRIVGLSPKTSRPPSLLKRDAFAARRLATLSEGLPGTLVFALIGDLHLGRRHLPHQLTRELSRRGIVRDSVVVHQNNEKLYWKLAERGWEQHAEVVRLRPGVFCVMNTPPWIKLQSHLKWNEIVSACGPHTAGGGIPIKGDRAAAEAYEEIEHADEIRDLVRSLRDFLEVGLTRDDDFSVRGPGDQKYLVNYLRRRGFSANELRTLQSGMRAFKSQFVPREQILYFSVVSLNHSASQAAAFLHAKLTGWDRVFLSPREDFYRQIWLESLAYFGSKVINHKRKCKGLFEIALQSVDAKLPADERRVAAFVHEHLEGERRGKKLITLPTRFSGEKQIIHFAKASKLLGHLLGHALYRALMDETVGKTDLRTLFRFPFHRTSPTAVRQLYSDWIQRLDKHHYRVFEKAESL